MKKRNKSTAPAAGSAAGAAVPAGSITLSNQETAAQYSCTYQKNCIVHVPTLYRGLISDVPPAVAAVLIEQGHKAFIKKEASK